MTDNQATKPNASWLLKLAIIFFIFIIGILSSYLILLAVYKNRIYPGVYLNRRNLGGKSVDQVKRLINGEVDRINQNGIIFYYNNQSAVVLPVVASTDADIAYQLINFNVEQTATDAYSVGRDGDIISNTVNIIKTLFFTRQVAQIVDVNKDEIKKNLANGFAQYEKSGEDAKLAILPKDNKYTNYEVAIIKEKLGSAINYDRGISDLVAELRQLNYAPVILSANSYLPKIYKNDCLNIESKVRQILNLTPLTLKYQDKEWIIDKGRLAGWLVLTANLNPEVNDKIIIELNAETAKEYLESAIAPEINKPPVSAKFSIINGKVGAFQTSQNGLNLDLAGAMAALEDTINNKKSAAINLAAKTIPSDITTDNINNLGIKEIIGTGKSNFAGSPKNRRHNIKIGADAVNGLLIKPDEEFSLIKALGKIDGSTGYLPELVIKENKTLPEFGGGLCQIGTTMFRATLASGLPITMRRNHSYRVSYYEPAGTDATIYDPWPDFRFINDTGKYILIQTRIDGDNLFFDFWGTKDGRLVEQSKPTINNIVKPAPPKLIETLDLPKGQKKCTEKAHNGADAFFDYKVTYVNSALKEKKFYSHYVPWQEVCLIGVDKLSSDAAIATTTPSKVQ